MPIRPTIDRARPTARPQPRIHPRVIQAAIGAGTALVILAWWQDTLGIAGLGDWLTNAGRLTGLLAGYVIVVQLLLMARVPLLEHSVGADQLARWHAFGGRYTVSLATAHTLLIIWGYSVTAHRGVVGQSADLLLSYPDVMMATVAFGLLLMVGWVSANAVRRRLAYETWYYLHFYTYLAVALAFSHQFATGADFATNLRNRVLWSMLYGGTGLLLLWYRFVRPVRAMLRHRLRVVSVQPEGENVVSLTLAGHHLEELRAEAGQFFRWRFLTRDHWWQSHPYSLSAPPQPNRLRITIKNLGDHSGALQRLRPGTPVLAAGPYGAFTASRRRRRRVLLLAGGVGITPLRALLETMPANRGDLTLVYRVNEPGEFLFHEELDDIASRRGARVHYVAGPPAGPHDPFVEDRLERLVPELAAHSVFVCGPPGFAVAAIAAARRGGVPAGHICDEQFAF
ncbi:MAG: ferredoxin reductase family protein [Mycobacteriales bacterium]